MLTSNILLCNTTIQAVWWCHIAQNSVTCGCRQWRTTPTIKRVNERDDKINKLKITTKPWNLKTYSKKCIVCNGPYQLAPGYFVRNKERLSAPLSKCVVPKNCSPGMGFLVTMDNHHHGKGWCTHLQFKWIRISYNSNMGRHRGLLNSI